MLSGQHTASSDWWLQLGVTCSVVSTQPVVTVRSTLAVRQTWIRIRVISKERAGNFWDILSAIFLREYHQNPSKKSKSSDCSQTLQEKVSLSIHFLCLSGHTGVFDVGLSFNVTMCTLPQCQCRHYNWSSIHLLHTVICLFCSFFELLVPVSR